MAASARYDISVTGRARDETCPPYTGSLSVWFQGGPVASIEPGIDCVSARGDGSQEHPALAGPYVGVVNTISVDSHIDRMPSSTSASAGSIVSPYSSRTCTIRSANQH